MSDSVESIIKSCIYELRNSGIQYFEKIVDIPNIAEVKQEEKVGTPQDFASLKNQALSCLNCRLCETRKNVVFGSGNFNRPLIAFVGDGPGEEEDALAEPFMGKGGQLLNSAIEKGLKLNRSELYMCNVVKCYPPNNRKPQSDEIEKCLPYLNRQLDLIKPRVIVCLGGTALRALTNKEEGITRVRGEWLFWEDIPLMPTFHPEYVLHNPSAKRPFWEDLKKVMEKLGI